MPFVFRCGRLVVLVLDARGDRDVFRKDYPILGTEQWGFIDTVFANLPADVEALAVMTPTPIASMDPNGQVQNLLGDRTDDVVAFSRGRTQPKSSEEKGEIPVAVANVHLSRLLGTQLNLGRYMISKIDELATSGHTSSPAPSRPTCSARPARLAWRMPFRERRAA
jgi:hypothetical protein